MVRSIVWVNTADAAQISLDHVIVVGIGYPIDQPFDLKRRVWDLTTPTDKNRDVLPERNGGYEDFFNFIENTVKPDIERRYPVDSLHQTLLGHSLGGEFTLRTLLNHPGSFQNYVALSPSIWWDGAALLNDIRTIVPDAAAVAKTRVYLGVGELEQHVTPALQDENLKYFRDYVLKHPEASRGKSVDAMVAAFDNHLQNTRMVDNARDMWIALAAKGFVVRFDSFPDEGHFSAVPSEIGRALPFVLKP
jgi:predicted alpha/beta superfamily hydrolase